MKYRGRSIIKSNMKLTANNSILPFISLFLLYSSIMEKIHLTSETRRNVNNTMLYDVLHSKINPIVNFMDKVFEDEPAPQGLKLRDLERLALLEKMGMDVQKLEMIVRQHSSPKSHISQLMSPYRNLLKIIECQDTNYLQTIRNLLLEK